jgi:Tol biopolymer transport system component
VAFASSATNLVTGDRNGTADIFVRDRSAGTVERVSLGLGGVQANSSSEDPVISPDGRFVAFVSYASNLVKGDTNDERDVFLFDRVKRTTNRVNLGAGFAQAVGGSRLPSLAADGKRVAFQSYADLVPGDRDSLWDAFLRDRRTQSLIALDRTSGGRLGNDNSFAPVLSADGRVVVFQSWSSDLIAGDRNGLGDVFVALP